MKGVTIRQVFPFTTEYTSPLLVRSSPISTSTELIKRQTRDSKLGEEVVEVQYCKGSEHKKGRQPVVTFTRDLPS